jgi:2-polyprenyl-3-methyl-5-hydroxy-6-metoxy-1,4-benzoquinol methylase
MNRFTINKKGFWETSDQTGHVHDRNLSIYLSELMKKEEIESVVDFGCGMGDYIRHLINQGYYCEAYDGNPNTGILTNGLAKVLDLSNSFDLKRRFDCVISLEVGEHIPKEYEHIFIDNISTHSKNLLVLSWAIKGQGGDGHVNCQDNDYVITEMEKRKFKFDEKTSNYLREAVSNAAWFKNTIMVFRRQ